ncbi:MAG: anthranilate phosphoribosyltransferase [Candidatus Gastranaerophilales bacterium]|nr:anthranilate phosphoribosyltransferase [Candidatus Gastranaerophilales bacterium]
MTERILNKALSGNILTDEDIESVLSAIQEETISSEQVSALLGAISARGGREFLKKSKGGATPNEVAAFAKGLRKISNKIDLRCDTGLMDVCGTGGDCLGTFNISTTVSFVAAAAGAKIVKHGNRSVSSKCGSADVLEKLGVKIDLPVEQYQNVLDEVGMVFLYAPYFNTCMAKIKKIRNSIGVPTIFNLLGPLINPVNLDYQVMGVYDGRKCELAAITLGRLGLKSAMAIHAKDGMDELSTTGNNIIYQLKDNRIKKIKLPAFEKLGLKHAEIKDLTGGDTDKNAKIILQILNGEKGAKRDIVLLNSAAALVVYGLAKDFKDGVVKSAECIDTGKALKVLERLRNVSQ